MATSILPFVFLFLAIVCFKAIDKMTTEAAWWLMVIMDAFLWVLTIYFMRGR